MYDLQRETGADMRLALAAIEDAQLYVIQLHGGK